jgi:hypothetical protein
LTVAAVAAISGISGAVVALDLLGTGSAVAERPVVLRQAHPASVHVAQTASQPASAPTKAAAPAQPPQAATAPASATLAQPTARPATAAASVPVAQSPVQPAAALAPHAAPAPQPAPAASAAPVEPKTANAKVPDSELTFSSGYARRRAVHEAVTSGSGAHVARVESQTQVGRVATKAKPKTTVARQNAPQDQSGAFARFDQRHQALALDQRDSHTNRRPPQQQGGLFGGGFFRGLF